MGTRGATPGATKRKRLMELPTSKPGDVNPPDNLAGEALAFWNRHASALAAADMLGEQDTDSFALLCRIWGRLSGLEEELNIRQEPKLHRLYQDLLRHYQSLSKEFGMTPTSRRKLAVSFGTNLERHEDKGEFDL